MGLVTMKCPNCGGTLQLDDSKDFGYCIFCGTQVRVQDEKTRVEVSGSVKFDETEKYGNCLNLANQAYTNGNMSEAYTYYTKALEIRQNDYLPVFRKGLCAGYLSHDGGLRVEEVVSGVSRGHDMAPDKVACQTMSEEIMEFVTNYELPQNDGFYSSDDCARYVKTVFGRIVLLNRLYPFIDQENTEDVVKYIETVLKYCGKISLKVMKFTAGTSVKKGKTETVYGTYPIPQNILAETSGISRRFTEEYNKLIRPRIEKVEEEIERIKEKIKQLPQIQQIAHMICNGWVFLLGLVLLGYNFELPAVVIWLVQIVLAIVARVKDKEKTAKTLYADLKKKKKELRGLNKQLKK